MGRPGGRKGGEEGGGQVSYHGHEQLVEPLQLELGAGPHVRPQGRLHQADAAPRQQLPGGARHVGAVVHLHRTQDVSTASRKSAPGRIGWGLCP